MIQGKAWGMTQKVFARNDVSIHRIEASQGGFCSRHSHRHKHNLFFVESGLLRVTIYRGGAADTSDIAPGQETSVPPGVEHRFEALLPTVAYEVYWTELDENDIQRMDSGGMKEHT